MQQMNNQLGTHQDSKAVLAKARNLIDITNKILDKKNKNISAVLKWFQTLNIPDYYKIPSNENDVFESINY